MRKLSKTSTGERSHLKVDLSGGFGHPPRMSLPAPSSPILIFDSGVGGLSVLAEIRRTLPDAPIIYAADLEAMPYGEKSEAEIAARVPAILGRLAERYHPRLITIACNTASTIALDMVREVLEIPIVGTVPAIKPAAAITQTGVIGLLGTAATVRQGYVDRLEARFAEGKTLLRHAAPDLVLAAEQKLRGETPGPAIFTAAAKGLVSQTSGTNIDIVVLACTHFPLVSKELATAFHDQTGQEITFIHGGTGIASRVATLTKNQLFERSEEDFAVFTGKADDEAALLPALKTYGIGRVLRL